MFTRKKMVANALKAYEKSVLAVYHVETFFGGHEEGGWYGQDIELAEYYPTFDKNTIQTLLWQGITEEIPRDGYFFRIEKKKDLGKEEYHDPHYYE